MSGHKGQLVGYVRVSTITRNEASQLEAIREVDRLFSEKISGNSQEREQLVEMMDYAREGDVVRVQSQDRLSRWTKDLLALIEELRAKESRWSSSTTRRSTPTPRRASSCS